MSNLEMNYIICCNIKYFNYNNFRDHVKEAHSDKNDKNKLDYKCSQCAIENQMRRGYLTTIKTLFTHCKNYHYSKLNFTSRSTTITDTISNADDGEIYFDSNEALEFDFDLDAQEEMVAEIVIPQLTNPENFKEIDELSIEERFCVELLKCKAELSVSFTALLLISSTILCFLNDLNKKNQLNNNIDNLISISKSKYKILNIVFKIANSINLFKEVKLRLKDGISTTKAYVLNLKSAFTKFLSKFENVQKLIIAKQKYVDPNIIKDIRQTNGFFESENELNMYLQIYIDDFDIKTGLSSSSDNTKICGTYMSIANLPYQLQSKRKDQFLLGCIRSIDIKNLFNINDYFKEIVDQVNSLNDYPIQLTNNIISKPILFSVLADNLESNFLQNLTQSFISSSCKYCNISYDNIQHTDLSTIRVVLNHVFKFCKSIVRRFIYAPDIFHDINEGVIFKFFELIFKLNSKDERKKWEYNYSNCGSFLKNGLLRGIENGNLIGTGSQKLEFFLIFPFLATENSIYDKHMYNLLRKIINVCFADEIKRDQLPKFQSDIDEFLKLYRTSISDYNKNYSSPNDKNKRITFTFKLHHLYHYPELIKEFGPLKQSSTIRGERFHQTHKYSIACSKSRSNVPKQICSNWSILYSLDDYISKDNTIKETQIVPPYNSHLLSDNLLSLIKNEYDQSKPLINLRKISIQNIKTEVDHFYYHKQSRFNNYPSFIKINLIMQQEDGHVWVKGEVFRAINYDQDKHSYVLEPTGQIADYNYSNPDLYKDFICFKYSDGKIYLLKHLLN